MYFNIKSYLKSNTTTLLTVNSYSTWKNSGDTFYYYYVLCIRVFKREQPHPSQSKKNLNSSSCQSLFHKVQILQLKPHQLQRKVNLFFLSHTQKTYSRALITFKLRQVNFSMNLSLFHVCIIFFQIVFPI